DRRTAERHTAYAGRELHGNALSAGQTAAVPRRNQIVDIRGPEAGDPIVAHGRVVPDWRRCAAPLPGARNHDVVSSGDVVKDTRDRRESIERRIDVAETGVRLKAVGDQVLAQQCGNSGKLRRPHRRPSDDLKTPAGIDSVAI